MNILGFFPNLALVEFCTNGMCIKRGLGVEGKAIVLSSEDCVIPYHYKTKFIQFYLPQTVPTPAITSFDSAAVIEAKTLPQIRPPLVWSATAMAAIAAVSAPGIWNMYVL